MGERRRVQGVERAKMRTMLSDVVYVIIRTPNMSGGRCVRRQVTEDSTALRLTGTELERWEEDLVEVKDFHVATQLNVSNWIQSRIIDVHRRDVNFVKEGRYVTE